LRIANISQMALGENFMRMIKRKTIFLFSVLLALLVLANCEQPAGSDTDPDSVSSSSDATQGALTVSGAVLSPGFDSATTSYTAEVNNAVTAVTISGTPTRSAAKAGGIGRQSLPVAGDHTFTITVTAKDGVTKKNYTLTVKRLSGTARSIASGADLAKIGHDAAYSLAANYELAADITLSDWAPVGDGEHPFSGRFDGKGYKITITSFAASALSTGSPVYLGVFGLLRGSAGSKAAVKNLKIEAEFSHTVKRDVNYFVGALAGYADSYSELISITVAGSVTFKNNFANSLSGMRNPIVFVGGITGGLYAAELTDSAVSAEVYGYGLGAQGHYNRVGGVVGIYDGGALIARCYSTGTVSGVTFSDPGVAAYTGTNVFAGGIAGGSDYSFSTHYRGKIEDCYSTGNIIAEGAHYWTWAGGIAGVVCGAGGGIYRCYATGAIEVRNGGFPYAGGITGNGYSSAHVEYSAALNPSITSAFEVGRVIGYGGAPIESYANHYMEIVIGESSETPLGSPETGAGMDCDPKPDRAFFETTLGWNFDTVWEMGSDGYPVLQGAGL
jgi:hypothetical protein